MTKVGVIGLGMMGLTHLDIYAKRDDVEVVAVSDLNPKRLSGEERALGNVEGQAQGGFDLSQVKKYAEGKELIADDSIELVDVCLPTPLHREYATLALEAGRHVLCEKPMALTAGDADALAEAAAKANGMFMVAQCMRFWPGWTWLKKAIDEKTYGSVKAAVFRRVASHPGGAFYLDGDQCGGAIVDLHVHDADFIQHCFGMPKAVRSIGYSKITNRADHVVAAYEYDDVPVVTAEGAWCMADSYGFTMYYQVNFERASAVFDLAAEHTLMLYPAGGDPQPILLEDGMGYDHEIAYFLECIQEGRKPSRVEPTSSAASVRLVEAEAASVAKKGERVAL